MDKKFKKVCEFLYIIGFVILISLPLLFINKDANAISFLENKKLAAPPQLFIDKNINKNYIKAFETYVDENIGFKQQAIEYNLAFMYKWFDKIKIPNYVMGEHENMFYTNNGRGIEVWQGINKYTDDQKEYFTQCLENCNQKMLDMDCQFYLMGIPDKEDIYPEFYPKSILRSSEETPLDDLLLYVSENSDVRVLPMKQSLLEAKEETNEYLYYKSFDPTHWNNLGAWVGYNVLLDYIQEDCPEIQRIDREDIELTFETSDTLEFLQKSDLLRNVMYMPDKIWHIELKNPNAKQAEDSEWNYVNTNSSAKKDIMIIGDSYINSFDILPVLAESFQHVYYVHPSSDTQIAELFLEYQPDFLVYEFVGRMFNYDDAIKVMGILENVN